MALGSLAMGVLVGGVLFSDTQPRSLIAVRKCDNCLSASEFAGLVGSVVVLKLPGILPERVFETNYTVVFKHPFPSYKTHHVLVPKRDIKDIGHLSEDDKAYIVDLYATAAHIISEHGYRRYNLWTNGPGIQDVNYLHFHLGVDE